MKCKQRYVPEELARLEDRVVLTAGHVTRGLSVVVSGLTPRQQVLSSRQQPVIAEINQAFTSFENDYGQARSAYFSAITNVTAGTSTATSANTAFSLYTTQRVELLAQQIISSFLQETPGTAGVKGQPATIKLLVNSKIVNAQTKSGVPTGLLLQSLTSTIPPAGASASVESLYTLSQDNAIQTAQATVINTVNIVKNGDFGNSTSKK